MTADIENIEKKKKLQKQPIRLKQPKKNKYIILMEQMEWLYDSLDYLLCYLH